VDRRNLGNQAFSYFENAAVPVAGRDLLKALEQYESNSIFGTAEKRCF